MRIFGYSEIYSEFQVLLEAEANVPGEVYYGTQEGERPPFVPMSVEFAAGIEKPIAEIVSEGSAPPDIQGHHPFFP